VGGSLIVESGNGLICIVMYNVAFDNVWVWNLVCEVKGRTVIEDILKQAADGNGWGSLIVESGNGLICIVMYNVAFDNVWVWNLVFEVKGRTVIEDILKQAADGNGWVWRSEVREAGEICTVTFSVQLFLTHEQELKNWVRYYRRFT